MAHDRYVWQIIVQQVILVNNENRFLAAKQIIKELQNNAKYTAVVLRGRPGLSILPLFLFWLQIRTERQGNSRVALDTKNNHHLSPHLQLHTLSLYCVEQSWCTRRTIWIGNLAIWLQECQLVYSPIPCIYIYLKTVNQCWILSSSDQAHRL